MDNSPGRAQSSPGSEFNKSPRPVGTVRNPHKILVSIKSNICNLYQRQLQIISLPRRTIETRVKAGAMTFFDS
jgi:hypothetical protein